MNEFQAGWKPLLAATVGTMCGLITITNYSQGFFVGPVTAEFGWEPAEFFFGFTLMMCVGVVTAPIVGALVPKFGVRKLGMFGLFGHALSYLLLSANPGSLVLWYLSWAAVAVLGAASLPIIWTAVLNGWFRRNRGKAVGITMAGTGIGAFLLPPVVEYFISHYGWRVAYQAVGIGAFLLALPTVFLLFKENEAAADGPGEAQAPPSSWGLTREQALRTGRFWRLAAVLFITVLVIVGLLSNFERILSSKGMERSLIAAIAAVLGITVIFGRLLVGVLVDRFWAPVVACLFFLLPIVALFVLINMQLTVGTGLLVAVCIGLAAGAELDLLAYLTSKYFGPRHYPAIFGGIFAVFSVGAGIAPPLMGEAATALGGYDRPLLILIGMLALSIPLFLSLGKYPEEGRREMASG